MHMYGCDSNNLTSRQLDFFIGLLIFIFKKIHETREQTLDIET